MNISPLNFVNLKANLVNSNADSSKNSIIIPKYNNVLAKDTVSFGGASKLSAKISDFVEVQVAADTPRLNRIATTFLDVLESVAFKLRDKGFVFDRAYCEQNPVKSPQSYTSKIVRSGKFQVPDTIRATLYCRNPYDLGLLIDGLLPEMKKRGYELAKTEMSIGNLIKRGYIPTAEELEKGIAEKMIPDIDIRLDDVLEQVIKLPAELRYSIGKPQKSGYEDIQMRFVRDFDRKKNPVQHELIILFGPETAKAKHEESEKVYKHLRELGELHVDLSDKTVGSHSYRASRYIDLIRQLFRGKVSEKLFLNAKNKDMYDMAENARISFEKEDIDLFESYFSGLKDRISSVYKEKKTGLEVSELAKKELSKDLRHDRAQLNKIHDELRKTIDFYNYQNDLKKS